MVGGCECYRPLFKAEPMRVPADAVPALVGGLPLGVLDDQVLKAIDPDAGSQLRLWVEFEHGPRLVMLHAPASVVAPVDSLVSPFTKDGLPPLEVDNVFCAGNPDGGAVEQLADGTFDLGEPICIGAPPFTNCDGGIRPLTRSYIKVQRAMATMSQLRLTPFEAWNGSAVVGVPDVMRLKLKLEDIQVGILEKTVDVAGTRLYPTPGDPHEYGAHVLSIGTATVECELHVGNIASNSAGCGEALLTCTRPFDFRPIGPYVQLDGVGGFILGAPITDYAGVVENMLVAKLTAGLQLHFEGFSASALTISPTDPSGLAYVLKLTGSEDTACSYVPARPPAQPAPIRGITRLRAQLGTGELVAANGDVKPYYLYPEVKVDWQSSPPGAEQFLPWTRQLGFRLFGSELSKLAPDGTFVLRDLDTMRLETRVELLREESATCWQKPLSTAELIVPLETRSLGCPKCLRDDAFLMVSRNGSDRHFTRDPAALAGVRSLAVMKVEDVDFVTGVLPLLEHELGDHVCPGVNCPDQCPRSGCGTWTRFEIVPLDVICLICPPGPGPGGGPTFPPTPRDGIPPVRFDLWAGQRPPMGGYRKRFDPRECPLPPPGNITDRRIVDPSVTIARFQVDSAEFQSDTVKSTYVDMPLQKFSTGFDPPEDVLQTSNGAAATRASVNDVEGTSSIAITLTNECPAHPAGDPHLSKPCWRSQFQPPEPGQVTVTRAFSDMTPIRTVLNDDVFGPGLAPAMSSLIGHQIAAVTGVLDRSGLRFFTPVPAIYRDIGLTTALRDYRETKVESLVKNSWQTPMLFDWRHGGSFPSPGPIDGHLSAATHQRWAVKDKDNFRDHPGHRFKFFADWNKDFVTAEWVGDETPSFCVENEKRFVSPRKLSFKGAGLEDEKELDAGVILTHGRLDPDGLLEISSGGAASGAFWPVLH